VLYFLIGADNLPEFHTWKEPRALIRLCRLVVMTRPGHALRLPSFIKQSGIKVLPVPEIGISATLVRDLAAAGQPLAYLVPKAVEQYIVRRKLYKMKIGRRLPQRHTSTGSVYRRDTEN
jgi:nicotinate-nucleotide adenylyltransferase